MPLCKNKVCEYNEAGLGGRFCNLPNEVPHKGIKLDENGKCQSYKQERRGSGE